MATVTVLPDDWTSGRTTAGYTASGTYLVDELAGSSHLQMAADAVQASGIPQLGERHPTLPGIRVVQVEGRLIADDAQRARVQVQWGVPTGGDFTPGETTPAIIRIGARLRSVTRSRDRSDKLIKAFLTGTDGKMKEQRGEVEFQIPTVYFQYTRIEPASPGDKARAFVGTVNSLPIFGEPMAKTWLCREIDGTRNVDGMSYSVLYDFERSPFSEGWKAVVWYKDEDGFIHKDAKPEEYEIYPSSNFFQLGI